MKLHEVFVYGFTIYSFVGGCFLHKKVFDFKQNTKIIKVWFDFVIFKILNFLYNLHCYFFNLRTK